MESEFLAFESRKTDEPGIGHQEINCCLSNCFTDDQATKGWTPRYLRLGNAPHWVRFVLLSLQPGLQVH
jgi:hypothetical protein